MKQISLAEARSLAINRQQLPSGVPLAGKAGARSAIERIGYVQIDTIPVIEREEAFLAALRKKIAAFATFNKCEKIKFSKDLGKKYSYILG